MKKFISIFATVLVSIVGVSQAAQADTRLSISSSTGAVLNGSGATITPSYGGVTEPTTGDWAYFKYEVTALNTNGTSGTVATYQLNTNPCHGTTSGASGSFRTCTTEIRSGRVVYNAGTNSYNNIYQSVLKITPQSGVGTNFQIRGWLDKNNNGRVEAYEPMSNRLTVQSYDPSLAKAFFNFKVDPPLLLDNNLLAYVSAGRTSTVVGSTTTVTGLVDPSLLGLEILNCSTIPCSIVSASGVWNANPQLERLEYKSAVQFTAGAKLIFNLYYNPYGDSTFKTAVKLGTRTFDYKEATIKNLETQLVSPNLITDNQDEDATYRFEDQRQNYAQSGLTTFTYKAKLTGLDSGPAVGKEVFINLDTKGMLSWSGFRADGVLLTEAVDDLITLRRITDKKGEVSVVLTVPAQTAGSQLELDAIIGGLKASEIPGTGAEEVVVWGMDSIRTLSLAFGTALKTDGTSLSLSATVRSSKGDVFANERVIFGASSDLILGSPFSAVNAAGTATTTVKVNPLADKEGSTYITAQILSAGKLVEAKALVTWSDYGKTIRGSASEYSAEVQDLVFDIDQNVSPGKIIYGSVQVADVNGIPRANELVELSVEGLGYLTKTIATTDANGAAKFGLVLAVGDAGTAKITARLAVYGITATETVLVSVSSKIIVTRNTVNVVVSNAANEEIKITVDGKTVATKTATGNSYRVTATDVAVGVRVVKVYVAGILIETKSVKLNN